MALRKEFTVYAMIKALKKFDPPLPIYDHYYDEEKGEEVWFSFTKPVGKQVVHPSPRSRKLHFQELVMTSAKQACTATFSVFCRITLKNLPTESA